MIDLKKFKGIIPANIVKTIPDYSIKLNCSSSSAKSYQIDKSNKILIIYVYKLPPKEKRNLEKIIFESFNDDKVILISSNRSELLDKLYNYNNSEDNQILSFFKPILSNKDWEALRASLYLRDEFKKHIPVTSLKDDIYSSFGDRGNTISNLCTAGYFEEVMIPLFNADQNKFWEYYNYALDMGITALFVNSTMNISKIRDEINFRLTAAKRYGLKYIHIHGIGNKNIKNIQQCIEKEKGNLGFTEKHLFSNKYLNVVVVELIL